MNFFLFAAFFLSAVPVSAETIIKGKIIDASTGEEIIGAAVLLKEMTGEGTVTGLMGWIGCFEKARLAGTVFAGGVTAKGDIVGHKALVEAREMGRKA